ncbi:AraC family transcriptional regulator [Streptomyces marincola]|uniref:AraC family transcriptional regulator n=1 Tax=Streptomyces marincola TaxID=2878388 RepID=A0A1W7D1L1_9ACTN|nr:AraC family transcriptional regulator [Streptomyces marincola]ARQ70971.1 AraC family transcriptional regulator [Streptomyces marincola]
MSQKDVLSELLKPLRLTDTYYSKWLVGGDWGVAGQEDSHAVLHYMVRGECFITHEGAEPVRLDEGDLALFPHGTAHAFSSAPGLITTRLHQMLPTRTAGSYHAVAVGDACPDTEILCASLHFDSATEPALYRALPPVIVLRAHMLGDEPLLLRTLESLPVEISRTAPGSRMVSLRAFEMVLVLSLRTAMERLAAESPALRALRHPGISRALTAMYASYATPWTVETLSREAGMSRSAFAQTFRELVGEPPARHLMTRRLQEARRLLKDASVPLHKIHELIGYQSHVGYHLAFRKEFGITPGELRASRTGQEST